jgi:hypothetical protein
MNCRSAAKLFSDQVEGTLDRDRSERLLAHLDRCTACAELMEIMELNITQLTGTPEPSMPAGLQQRLASIPLRERAAGRLEQRDAGTSGGHWLFSNAAAAVILALFITANLTWFNPDFQDSIHGCRRLISDQSARALELAADLGEDFHDLKQQVESRMDEVRDAGNGAGKDIDDAEGGRSASLVTEIIRALGLIGA